MKLRDFMIVAATVAFAACGSPYRATDTTVVVAPSGVQTAFTTQYPTASNVVWTNYDVAVVPIDLELAGWTAMDEGDYLVRFDMDNDNYYAWYDENGNWIGTAYAVKDYSTMPAAVTNVVNTQFSGYTITSVNREFQKDRVVYEVELKGSDNRIKMLVDGSGNIIKQKTKALN
jgi:uncharacterized membrane protein YkoI